MPANPVVRWDHADLIRRVVDVLDLALRMVRSMADTTAAPVPATRDLSVAGRMREKAVSDTAMLLLCVEPLSTLDDRIRDRFETLAVLLLPHARHDDVLAGMCLDPATARDRSIGHIILSRLGFPDPRVDALLSRSLAMGPNFGPERLPHRVLEQAWLVAARPRARESGPMVVLRVLGPDDWADWRELRLAALRNAPEAFGAKLADWQGDGDTEQRWRARLRGGTHDLLARVDGEPAGMVSGK